MSVNIELNKNITKKKTENIEIKSHRNLFPGFLFLGILFFFIYFYNKKVLNYPQNLYFHIRIMDRILHKTEVV
ncbi:hypothetical protein UACE39S_01026 [Ureibacillus acetophenoni]